MREVQKNLFERVRASMANPGALPDELVGLLGISKDSAYRRLKGEKQLSIDELQLVARAYGFSLDDLMDLWSDCTVFQGDYVNSENFKMESYLQSMLYNLQRLDQFDKKELSYLSKDLPVFYYLMFPEVAAFKFFVWTKTQMQFEEMRERKFSFDILTRDLKELAFKVAEAYTRIPSTEILNADNILNDLRQLEYYKETGLFANPSDPELIYCRLHEMVDHMEGQASSGKKSVPGGGRGSSYKLFVNDYYVGDNTLLAVAGDLRLVYLNHAAINFVFTSSPGFVDYNEEFMQNIIRRSSLISEVGERTRACFFHLIHERINGFQTGRSMESF